MGETTPDFQSLLVRLEGRLAPEFALFLRDISRHRNEKFALECLIDQLGPLGIVLSADRARDILDLCDVLGIDQKRRSRIPGLLDFSPSALAADTAKRAVCSLEDLVAATDPVAFGKANGAGELLIVRALREKFGFSFDEAMLLLQIASDDGGKP